MKRKSLLLVFILSLSVKVTYAQWQLSNGNPDAYAWSIAKKDTEILAGVMNGIYFSDNNGVSWILKSCPVSYVRTIVVKDSVIFINSDFDGVYKSIDNGTTWISIDSGLANPSQAWSLAQNDSLLILGTSGSFSGDTASIYISSNDGAWWTKVYSLGTYDVFYSFAVSGDEVFVGVLPSGLFYSNDKGVTWTLKNGMISAKHIALADTNLLCGITGGSGGIFLSTDKGVSWVTVLPLYHGNAFVTSGNFTFAGTSNGFYYSIDDGYTWTNDNNGLPPLTQVISICVADSFVFIGTTVGIYRRNIADIGTTVNDLNLQNSFLNVFPNPSTGMFIINSTYVIENGTVEIYNSLGESVFKEQIEHIAKIEINLKRISDGIYFVEVNDGERQYCKKIIIDLQLSPMDF